MRDTLNNEKGSITVWISLLMLVMIMFFLVLVEGARLSTARVKASECTQLAAMSIMAEYDPNIYGDYHVYIYDRGYGSKDSYENHVKIIAETAIKNSIDKDSSSVTLNSNKIKISGGIYNNSLEIKNQIVNYMNTKLSKEQKKNVLNNFSKYSDEDILIAEYIVTYFSSYKNESTLRHLNRDLMYEQEFIVCGGSTDDVNISAFEKKMNKLSGEDMSVSKYSQDEYNKYMRMLILKSKQKDILRRAFSIIISNSNRTYDTDIMMSNCFCKVSVTSQYELKAQNMLFSLWKEKKVKKYGITTTGKFEY